MPLKVTIELENENKKSKIEISETDQMSQLLIISKVFDLFGVKTDILSEVLLYEKIGNAYKSFFSEVNPIENAQKDEKIDKNEEAENKKIEISLTMDRNEIKERLLAGYKDKDGLETTYKAKDDLDLSYRVTGIKYDHNGTPKYRLKYVCPVVGCHNSGIHFIYDTSRRVHCHRCDHEMIAIPSTGKFLERDSNRHFFRAGKYQDPNI